MRFLAVIGLLLATQYSLFAITVYRYQFSNTFDGIRPLGSPGSGYIDLRYSSGEYVSPRDALYDFQVTGLLCKDSSGVYPDILPITFSLANAYIEERTNPFMNWGEKYSFQGNSIIMGSWSFVSAIPPLGRDDSFVKTDITAIWSFAPYYYSPSGQFPLGGSWVFTGARSVPETSGTALNLTISAIVLAVLRWRQLTRTRTK